jgi:MMPL family
LSNGAGKLTTRSTTATTAFAALPPTLQSMRDVLGHAKAATRDLRGVQLAMRIREELRAGIGTGVVRAFAGTGGVVPTSGIVFGITMFALAGSTVPSIEQIGIAVGVGLLLDTLIVRTFLMPSLVALLGRWFWWPRLPSRLQAGG